jgi:hypothetical protein
MLKNIPSRTLSARSVCAVFVLLAFLLTLVPTADAARRRQRRSRRQRPEAAAPARAPRVQTAKPRPTPRPPSAFVPGILVAESGKRGDVYHSGDVLVRSTSNSHMIVPIGMSRGAVAFVEFPAADPFYSFHEGNAKIAYVNCGQNLDGSAQGTRQCTIRPTDALVLQPGENFPVPAQGDPVTSTTVIHVQRASGMVVTFIIYPVLEASESATRVVVSYDVKEVLAARQKAGLMTQLVPADALVREGGVPASSPLVANAAAPQDAKNVGNFGGTLFRSEALLVDGNAAQAPTAPEDELGDKTVAELRRVAGANPQLRFSKPVHGLSLAVASNPPPVSNVVVQVIAVRNTLTIPVRLLPEQPDIRIMQAAKKGEAINDQTVSLKYVATTLGDDNVLQPNTVYFFAIAYEPPALTVRQSLYASFAHMLASDEPAVTPITALLAAR